jgi:DNA-binding NarL/FixJ family response regulator
MMTDVVTVIVADDHIVTRQGVRAMLGILSGVEVVGEAATGRQAVELCEKFSPTIAFVDMQMPEMNGMEAIGRIKAACPNTRVIVLTVEEDERVIMDAVKAGASGYLSKAAGADDLERAIRESDPNGVYMSPSIASKMIASVANGGNGHGHMPDGHRGITGREHEVLRLLGQGLTSRTIARRLGISERTVDTHVGNMYRRLGVTNRVDAVLAAMRMGLIQPPQLV